LSGMKHWKPSKILRDFLSVLQDLEMENFIDFYSENLKFEAHLQNISIFSRKTSNLRLIFKISRLLLEKPQIWGSFSKYLDFCSKTSNFKLIFKISRFLLGKPQIWGSFTKYLNFFSKNFKFEAHFQNISTFTRKTSNLRLIFKISRLLLEKLQIWGSFSKYLDF
jgi:hypothetical protein